METIGRFYLGPFGCRGQGDSWAKGLRASGDLWLINWALEYHTLILFP